MLILVRHGQTKSNASGIVSGISRDRLSNHGKAQVSYLLRHLKKRNITKIFSSDLPRAIQTANIFSRYFKEKVIRTSLLRERNFGRLEKSTREELKVERQKRGQSIESITEVWEGFPEVESDREIWQRFNDWLEQYNVKELIIENDVLAVTHAGVVRAAFYSMLGIPYSRPHAIQVNNGGALTISLVQNVWSVREIWPNST